MLLLLGFLIGVILDLLNFQTPSDIRIFSLIFLWVLTVRTFHFKSDMTFKLALGFLGLLLIFFIFARGSLITERIAVWIYLCLVVGVVQQFFELRKESKVSA
jgi:hypothetical protein